MVEADDDAREQVRRDLRAIFKDKLEGMVDRHLAVRPHGIVPDHHFAPASAECIDDFRTGNFISCISLVQSVAEGIAKFLLEKAKERLGKDQEKRVQKLGKMGVISPDCCNAFMRIANASRNDFHHMNPGVPRDREKLYRMATSALGDLAIVEGEVFGCDVDGDGRMVPHQPKYWDLKPDGTVPVYLRLL